MRRLGAIFGRLESVVNPIVRGGVLHGWSPRCFAVIETTGRRTGSPRQTPVGNGFEAPDAFWLVAEHGDKCSYVANIRADPNVRVCVRGGWRKGFATIEPDDDPLARRARINASNGLLGRMDGFVFSATATTPLSIRVQLA